MTDITFEKVLADLGIGDDLLTSEQRRSLDEDGFVIFPDLIDRETVAALGARFDELVELEGADAGKDHPGGVHNEPGTRWLGDCVNKGEIFEITYSHPVVLSAVNYVFRRKPFRMFSVCARCSFPGHGYQPLHPDWGTPATPGDFQICNSVWMLDDYTELNGATRVVPGSHLADHLPPEAPASAEAMSDMGDWVKRADPTETHPRQRFLTGRAGTVAVTNAHTWHSGSLNRSEGRRRGVLASWTRRHNPQQVDQQKQITPETYARLTPALRYLVDVHLP